MKKVLSNQLANPHESTSMRVGSATDIRNSFWMRISILILGCMVVTSLPVLSQDDGEYRDIQTLMGGNESVGGYGAV